MITYPKHLYWLDTLRFVAALVVAISHIRAAVFADFGSLASSSQSFAVAVLFAVTRISNEAVIVFFVLSGFLVGGRAVNKMLCGTFNTQQYCIDRVSRIFVPLVPALCFTALVLFFREQTVNPTQLLANIFALQGVWVESYGSNEPLWSLSYEVWFYILTFAIGWAVSNKKLSIAPLLLVCCVSIVFVYLDTVYLFCWLLGAVVFFMPRSSYPRIMLVTASVFIILAVAGIQLSSGSRSIGFSTSIPIEMFRLLLALGMSLFVRHVIEFPPASLSTKYFETVCASMAKSSYTLYLTHFPLLHLLQFFGLQQRTTVNLNTVVLFIGIVGLCLGTAVIFYWFFERHTLAVRQWLGQRLTMHNRDVHATD